MNHKIKFLVVFFLISHFSFSQEGVAVYSDYLSDNYYLIHPSMAGAANCAKLRLTARKQWLNQTDAPSLQTISFNGRIGERSGAGAILFNDKNGYHSQTGVKLTYAHHLMFSRDEIDLNQLSFGMSAAFIQSKLDETEFLNSGDYDPIVDGIIVQNATYFNLDIGASYNYLDFYIHATVHNAIETKRKIYTDAESANLKKGLLSAGYVFGNKNKILWEPSILFQYIDKTNEKSLDFNMKAYKSLDFGKIWAALSYRRYDRSADQTQYITPIIGVNSGKFMAAYTYSYLTGVDSYNSGGFHQITLGLDLFCTREKYDCNCPAVN
jgi:type IX secretion system PorP/SprF family membrane protein